MNFKRTNRKIIIITILVIYSLILRWSYIAGYKIPFTFDHGKDSLAVLHMITKPALKFIGPWTSIPGVYFGPGWYYLLAPGYFISNGNPMSAPLTMMAVNTAAVIIAYLNFGTITALLIASTSAWLTTSTSAWNPYPMPVVTLLILTLWLQFIRQQKPKLSTAFWLGICASLGFHFSAAFAIFYLISLPIFYFIRKPSISYRHVALFLIGLVVPFLPQIMFELKNNFIETRSLIHYFSQPEPNALTTAKVKFIISTYSDQIINGSWIGWRGANAFATTANIIIGGIILVGTMWKSKRLPTLWPEVAALTGLSFIGFMFLHYNTWYSVALIAGYSIISGSILKSAPISMIRIIIAAIVISSAVSVWSYHRYEVEKLNKNPVMLSTKLAAIKLIREKAENQPFASYHYEPAIYDFSYQFIYYWQAMHGMPLPTHFAYSPNVPPYIPEKDDLTQHFDSSTASPQKIFFIVEKPERPEYLESWWQQQKYGSIISTYPIGDSITIYEATPAN